jgi:hypothetical protein
MFPEALIRSWEGRIKLVDNISEDKMTANEIQHPAMGMRISHLGNVG